jgi:NTP pyrophosphatase (non-canonical NTP hydrolase)
MVSDSSTPVQELRTRVGVFARARDWDKFHSPKNLSMGLAVEASELLELFQWKTEQESWAMMDAASARRAVREEIADVAIFLLNLCNRLEIDLASAVVSKLAKNARKYPARKARGSAAKYTTYVRSRGNRK